MASPTAADAAISAQEAVEGLTEARERTLALVAQLDDRTLERVHSTLMSPLVWDLGHIAAFEDLWLIHRFGARPMLRDDLADVYDAFETPRAGRGELPFLRPREAREYLAEVRERALEVIEERGVGDGFVHEMVIRHEMQHCETMLQTIQLGRIQPYGGICEPADREPEIGERQAGLQLIDVPAGPCMIGAPGEGFAYDNERGRHLITLGGYQLGRAPITNASYLRFVEGGGYVRREWWSDEGWAWKEQYDITRPAGWSENLQSEWRLGELVPLHPDRPVVHVSWFEAEAFARAHDARLPTEYEWEKAATWDQEREQARRYPWGSALPVPGVHANVDHHSRGPAAIGSFPEGASPHGCLGMIGDVWEWTSSSFTGYPGFVAHPYPEYSEVFFGDGYKSLRGGSWATRARVITPTFRNWDYPQRRQIFSGFRIARDM
ncbi:MAG: ergothioneine biosynthesis protein EgtB [Solirubrobacteraceae bacterium]